MAPKEVCPRTNPLELVNVTLCRKRIFADVTKDSEIISVWILAGA